MAASGTGRSHSAAAKASQILSSSNYYHPSSSGKTIRENVVNTTAEFARAWLSGSTSAAGGSFINRSTIDSFRQKAQRTVTNSAAMINPKQQYGYNPSEQWVLPHSVEIVAKILYVSIISFAVIGNLCVLFVYLCTRRKRTYFRYVLVNLAVADLLLACVIPFTMYQVLGSGYWPFSDFMCKAVLYMQLLSVCASVFTLVMVTSSWRWIMSGSVGQNRGGGGSAPQRTNQYSFKPFVALWVTLAIVSCVQLKIAHIEHYATPNGNITKCLESGSMSPQWVMGYTLFTFGLTYAGPLIHLVINFGLIRRKFDKLSRASAVVGRPLDRSSTPASLLMLGVQHVNPSFSHNQNSDASSRTNSNNQNKSDGGAANRSPAASSAGNGSNSNKRGSDDTIQQQQRNNDCIVRTQRRHSPTSPVNHRTAVYNNNNNYSVNSSIAVDGSDTAEDRYKLKVRRKVLRIFKIIVLIFAVCWAPLQLFFLIFTFILPHVVTVKTLMAPSVIGTLQITYIICHLLAMSSACVNPVVLSLTHRNFRNDLKSLTEPVCRYIQPRKLLAYAIHAIWLMCCCFLCTTCCRDNTYYAEGEEADADEDEQGAGEPRDGAEAREDCEGKRRQLAIDDHIQCNGTKSRRSTGSKTGSSGSNKSPHRSHRHYAHMGGKSPEMTRKVLDDECGKAFIEKVVNDKSYYFYRQTLPKSPPHHEQQNVEAQVMCSANHHRRQQKKHRHEKKGSGTNGSSAASKSGEHVSTRRSSSEPTSLPPMRGRAKPIVAQSGEKISTRKPRKPNVLSEEQANNKSNSNLSDERSQKNDGNRKKHRSSSNSRPNSDAAGSTHTLAKNKQTDKRRSTTNLLVERLKNKTNRSKSNSSAHSSRSSSSSESHYAQAHETTYTEQELREGVIILKPSSKNRGTISSSSVGSSHHNNGGPQLLRSTIPLVILSSGASPTHTTRYTS